MQSLVTTCDEVHKILTYKFLTMVYMSNITNNHNDFFYCHEETKHSICF